MLKACNKKSNSLTFRRKRIFTYAIKSRNNWNNRRRSCKNLSCKNILVPSTSIYPCDISSGINRSNRRRSCKTISCKNMLVPSTTAYPCDISSRINQNHRLRSCENMSVPSTSTHLNDISSSNNNYRSCKNIISLPSISTGINSNTSEENSEWKEEICPICMDPPHNAVRLICSSHEKGCKPFICDTSYRHSNCFDQLCKLHGITPLTSPDQPIGFFVPLENRHVRELACPLCRGTVTGWTVIKGARTYMNSKVRSCALESCDFSGNYGDLRKHARVQHPAEMPVSVESDDVDSNGGVTEDDGEVVIDLSHLERRNRDQVLELFMMVLEILGI